MDLTGLEAFALAEDRAAFLETLIPGTEDHYYYSCLHNEHQNDRGRVTELLQAWEKHHGRTSRLLEIEHRQALLGWERDAAATAEHIRYHTSPSLSHQRKVEGRATSYPTRLDLEGLQKKMRERALGASTVHRFTDRALDALLDEGFSEGRLRSLLERLERPDHPRLVEAVLSDLEYKKSGGFGSIGLHRRLLQDQLDALLKERPKLLNDGTFVEVYLERLRPNEDVDLRRDRELRQAYLDRLWAFASRLKPAFNSLKAHVLYHRLQHDRAQGVLDRERLEDYLALPRDVSYANPKLLEKPRREGTLARLHAGHQSQTLLDEVGDDESLVRELLSRILVEQEDYQGLDDYVRQDYLRKLRAEAKILAGVGDMERWYAELDDPSYYQRLKERVDIEFAPTNPEFYRGDDAVTLEVDVKNVPTLVVKVFAINTYNYFLSTGQEVDTSIDLDGLVASEEHTHTYDEPPLRRVRRTFSFDSLSGPGVYVVELIGNGRSSRALIRKGSLRTIGRIGAAGHVFTILDEDNDPVPAATLHLGGREYAADADGGIVVPFSTSPRRERMLLRQGNLTTVEVFHHRAEHYGFSAGIYVDRESLVAGSKAQVLVRAQLHMEGRPLSLELLEDVRFRLSSSDHQGVVSSMEVDGFELHADREAVHTFQVPEDLSWISFELEGEVQQLSTGKRVKLKGSRRYTINQIDTTDLVQCFHLARTAAGYVVYQLGKTGEARADEPLTVTLHHEDYTDSYQVTLQTDAGGRVELGPLPGFTSVRVHSNTVGATAEWALERDGCQLPVDLHGVAGELLRVPYMGSARQADREVVSLLQKRGQGYLRDCRASARLEGGYLELDGLPAGEYDLLLREDQARIAVKLTAGKERGNWAVSARRLLERGDNTPLHLPRIDVSDAGVTIHVAGATRAARVHVFGTRFYPEHSASQDLAPLGLPGVQAAEVAACESHTVSGRDIGDEYRYILERKLATKYPGNMLRRPGLLLNPWARSSTDTSLDEAGGGGSYANMGAPAPKPSAPPRVGGRGGGGGGQGVPNLDFLQEPTRVIANLSPDGEGQVRIPLDALQGVSQLRVVAVDTQHSVWREVGIEEARGEHQDLRLRLGLEPEEHFTEQKQVSVVPGGESLTLDDITTSQIECYDTLARVHALFSTLSEDEHLATFAFVLRWPELSREEKCSKYSEFACHELNLFVAQKDPEFFKEVVQPYLRNKRHKTFLDRYLLEDDLSGYLRPWEFGRLNAVERTLLARRIDGEQPHTARHLRELCDLLPPNVEHRNTLFKTAIRGSALDADDSLGFGEAARAQKEEMAKSVPMSRARRSGSKKRKSRAMAPPPPAAKAALGFAAGPGEADGFAASEIMADLDDMLAEEECEAPFPEERERDMRADLSRREAVRQLYRKLEATQELAENDYYKLLPAQMGPDLVTVNRFWRDFAAHAGDGPFLSPHFAEAARNFTEMMCALAVLDLPFKAQAPETSFEGSRMELRARAAAVVFHKEIKQAEPAAEQVPILVSQNYFKSGDRYRHEGGEQYDKYVTGELLTHQVYICQVVLTNPTSTRHKLDLLLQIPRGAVPVSNGFQTRGMHVQLASYATQSFEYSFYFPSPGVYPHFPVHVAKNEALIASAPARDLEVVLEPTTVDTEAWDWISQNAEPDAVLAYLRESNLDRLDLSLIAWRVRESAEFFAQLTQLLRERHVYEQTIWAYGLRHQDAAAVREYLLHQEGFLDAAGLFLDCGLVTSDPVVRQRHEHLEYFPLVNARAHRLGAKLKILNDRFSRQYQRFMRVLAYRPKLTADDLLAVSYYLFLQDRVDEALATFARADASGVETRLQLDYLRAYAALYRGELEEAREAARPHQDHPVDRWRKRFTAVLTTVDEALGASAKLVDEDDHQQAQTQLASSEPSFEFSVEQSEVKLSHRNLSQAVVNTYAMDIELLFSRQPFVEDQQGQFDFVAPNHTQTVTLEPGSGETSVALDPAYRSSNVIVEVAAAGKRRSVAHYAHALRVQMIEGYGQVQVHHKETGKPLPQVYVKVYARQSSGQVKFFKDGYTDMRGRFDYATLSTGELDSAERLALLVLSPEHGAVIREAEPPKQ